MSNFARKPFEKEISEEVVGLPEPKEVAAKLKRWFPTMDAVTVDTLVNYRTELLRFNKAVNLISASTMRNLEQVHIADCVLAAQLIEKGLIPKEPLYDFGSGNGLPGLIVAICVPKLSVVLVERDSRKVEFLNHVASSLKLGNVKVMGSPLEDIPSATVKNGVARGLAPLHKAMLITRKQVAKGGRFFHLKGDGWATELGSVPSQLFSFWSPSLFGQYRVPETSSDMAVILTEKIAD